MTDPTLHDLLQIMERLRGPDGCPWDKEQTHESILNCLVEEAYEFIDAARQGLDKPMAEELGDVLLQVVFHAQMAKERGAFDFHQVMRLLSEKLVRRHPHVFAKTALRGEGGAEAVQEQWDAIKRAEKEAEKKSGVGLSGDPAPGEETGTRPRLSASMAGLPKGLPALLAAVKIQQKAAKAGFDWPNPAGALRKTKEELAEFEAEIEHEDEKGTEEELGDLLFSVVNLARLLKIDPEKALYGANRKFIRRFRRMEEMAEIQGLVLEEQALPVLDALWDDTKKEEDEGRDSGHPRVKPGRRG